jgi:ADP-ribose pyrophosphatase YjhB (NUDIX family)
MARSKQRLDHAVVDVLIIDDDKFLLVEEGRPERKGLFNLPGGHVKGNETLSAAAIREVKEETGYNVTLTGLVGIYQTIYPHINVSGPVFAGQIVGGRPTVSGDHPSLKWVTQAQLHELDKAGRLFTKHPILAVEDFLQRGVLPLDAVVSSAVEMTK